MAIRAYRRYDQTRLSVFQGGVGFGVGQRLRSPLRVAMLLPCGASAIISLASSVC